jgi:hypothetical protein
MHKYSGKGDDQTTLFVFMMNPLYRHAHPRHSPYPILIATYHFDLQRALSGQPDAVQAIRTTARSRLDNEFARFPPNREHWAAADSLRRPPSRSSANPNALRNRALPGVGQAQSHSLGLYILPLEDTRILS